MEPLGERPVWSMSGCEMLSTLDTLEAELARLQTYRLQVIAGLEGVGHAEEIGGHDTARLLAFRYRLNGIDARRDVRLALALPRYVEVSAALPDAAAQYSTDVAVDVADDVARADDRGSDGERRWLLRPAQAEAIVSALERVPSTVPAEDVEVAEQQLVALARHLSPAELRKAGKEIRDLLDADGPEPNERKAYARESLTMSTADNGVTFRGYLANENAELFRALIHAGAKPRKTVDGEADPRSRDKRQADALTSVLTTAAAAADAGHRPDTTTGHTTTGHTTTGYITSGPVPHACAGPDCAACVGDASAERAAADGVRGGAGGWVPGFGAKANITVTIDLADLKAAAADATGKLVYGDDLSAGAIRRLACDAKIIPLVLGTNSEPLDVGRAERLVNRAMRRALNA
ncbi:DUF222 domain-containing protein [Kribbella sp. NPDC050820]|uniref:DUF222 domain-containing protein n=1 Tax=Kribbella sp. NPDC050820 TaxID=3155408 RepID=UPI003407FB45